MSRRKIHYFGEHMALSLTCEPICVCVQCSCMCVHVQSCLTLSDPMDCSLWGSSVHGVVQARVLEWGAIAFTDWAYFKSQGKCLIRIPINCIKNQIKHGRITLWIFFELHTHIMYIFPCIFSSSIKIFTIILQYQEKKIRNWCIDSNSYFN